MTNCLFCDIINGKQGAEIVYQDDKIVAFKDIYPKAPTHLLIIPKQHISTLNDADDAELLGNLMLTAQKLAKDLGIANDGYRVTMNCNKAGGQVIFHIHLHLLGGRAMEWPPG